MYKITKFVQPNVFNLWEKCVSYWYSLHQHKKTVIFDILRKTFRFESTNNYYVINHGWNMIIYSSSNLNIIALSILPYCIVWRLKIDGLRRWLL